MQEMDGIRLHRSARRNRKLQLIQVIHQLIKCVIKYPVDNKSETPFLLVIAQEYYCAHKTWILQKGLCDQQRPRSWIIHISKINTYIVPAKTIGLKKIDQ